MYAQEVIEELKKIILPVLEASEIELVEFNLVRSGGRPTLRLLVDKKYGGIELQECARLNVEIGSALEAQATLDTYILEVSSPGLDRPLKINSDFLRCINRKAKFFLLEPVKDKIELDGSIIRVEGEAVVVDINGEDVEIPLAKINKAKQLLC